MTTPRSAARRGARSTRQRAVQPPERAVRSAEQEYRADVAAYVAAGGDESVQRVITAVHGLARKLDQWYARQLADLDLSAGEWAVLSQLARSNEDEALTPSQLAEVSCVAPSSMTHRLDRMAQRNLIARAADPDNRTRVLITLTDEGWQTFKAAVRESDMVESDVLGPLSRHQREDLASLLELLIKGLDEPAAG
ncbi:MAG TPA: MarR family transcriptional regulator [Dermatophilaceae bacterium]|nr:MarR family transcriptional regulator [Dermatophilaceae bacterium]